MSYFCNILIFSVYLPFPVTKLKLMFENVICFFCIRFSTRHEKLRTKTWQIGIKSCGSIGQKFRVSVVLIKLMVRTYLFMQTSVLCYCLPRVVTFFLLLEMHFCTCQESQSVCSWMWTVLLLLGMSHTHTRLTALCTGLSGWAGIRKEKLIWILLKQETVSGSGIR